MKYKQEKPNTDDHALTVAVISAFRSIHPSYTEAHKWYTNKNKDISPIVPVKSRYYIPLFGSVFASALALVMLITSQNTLIPPNNELAVGFKAEIGENQPNSARLMSLNSSIEEKKVEKPLLAKIDEQVQTTSRTQDEVFTESLNVETSLNSLFE